jgi:hypothetical protein
MIIVTPPRTFPGNARQRRRNGTNDTFMRRNQEGARYCLLLRVKTCRFVLEAGGARPLGRIASAIHPRHHDHPHLGLNKSS